MRWGAIDGAAWRIATAYGDRAHGLAQRETPELLVRDHVNDDLVMVP